MRVPPKISERIQQEIAALADEPIGHINYEGIRFNALPVWGTIGEVWLLRSDGSFWTVDSDAGVPLAPLRDDMHTTALVAAVGRYPWLQELLPSRPTGAIDCGECGGTGRIGPRGARFCPSCNALGWLDRAAKDS